MNKKNIILVTGATGYIGGRLVLRLLEAGYRVRTMARSYEKLRGRPWINHPRIECVQADLQNVEATINALKGCTVAYYLVHSMMPGIKDFAKTDRIAASNFVKASDEGTLKRIIYLGGLGWDEPFTSQHLISRYEVGQILRSGRVPVTTFRSGHILGSGSASFEILRYVAERLPIILIPREIIDTLIQPICIRNVLIYLVECLKKEETIGESFDIGGPEVITYKDLLKIYSEQAGLSEPMFITPSIPSFNLGKKISHWLIKLLLPLSPNIVQPLLDGLNVKVITKENRIEKIVPQHLMPCCYAIDRAIQKDSLKIVETRWSDAGQLSPPEWVQAGDAPYSGGTLLQGGYKIVLDCCPDDIWSVVCKLGGYNGWYYGDSLWQIRGWMDQIAGGVGLRRGRRHPEELSMGDTLDFWRVLDVCQPKYIVLLAEMKLPGEALLSIEIHSDTKGSCLSFGTRFRPRGLYGILYWYSLLPFHNLLFHGMLNNLAEKIGKPIIHGPEVYKPGPLTLDYRLKKE